jgi:hypothetical protein
MRRTLICMPSRTCFLAFVLISLLPCSIAAANSIFLGTGVGGTVGQQDSGTLLVSGPIGGLPANPYVVAPWPTFSVWPQPFPGTQWVAPALAGNGIHSANLPPGTYVYELQFTLPAGFSSPLLSVQFNTDNDSVSVELNGTAVSFTPSSQPNNIGSAIVSDPALYLVGTNTLSIGVFNWLNADQPTGLNLVGSVTFVREPSSFVLVAFGAATILGPAWKRRRRRAELPLNG